MVKPQSANNIEVFMKLWMHEV